MTNWTTEELNKIGTAEELQLESMREDGTLRKPVIMWMARVDDALYVRAARGSASTWLRGAKTRHAGRVHAGGVVKDVTLAEEGDNAINDKIDAAYRSKYRIYPQYVAPLLTPDSRSTTLKLIPR